MKFQCELHFFEYGANLKKKHIVREWRFLLVHFSHTVCSQDLILLSFFQNLWTFSNVNVKFYLPLGPLPQYTHCKSIFTILLKIIAEGIAQTYFCCMYACLSVWLHVYVCIFTSMWISESMFVCMSECLSVGRYFFNIYFFLETTHENNENVLWHKCQG